MPASTLSEKVLADIISLATQPVFSILLITAAPLVFGLMNGNLR